MCAQGTERQTECQPWVPRMMVKNDEVLLELRYRRRLRDKGPLSHSHPNYLKGILYAYL